jgi:hypothetical protein
LDIPQAGVSENCPTVTGRSGSSHGYGRCWGKYGTDDPWYAPETAPQVPGDETFDLIDQKSTRKSGSPSGIPRPDTRSRKPRTLRS